MSLCVGSHHGHHHLSSGAGWHARPWSTGAHHARPPWPHHAWATIGARSHHPTRTSRPHHSGAAHVSAGTHHVGCPVAAHGSHFTPRSHVTTWTHGAWSHRSICHHGAIWYHRPLHVAPFVAFHGKRVEPVWRVVADKLCRLEWMLLQQLLGAGLSTVKGDDGVEGALHHGLGSLVGQVCGEHKDLALLLHVLRVTGGYPSPGSTLDPKCPHPSPEPSSIRAICSVEV